VPFPLTLIRRDWTLFFVGFRSWRKRARWAWHKLNAAPSAIRIVVIAATVLAVFSATNLVYQVVRKPTEMLFPVSGAMNKMPAETWQQYAPLFREYSTATITRELLAALAQVEGAGYEEAARIIDVPIGTVRSRVSRGREAIRKLMDRRDGMEAASGAAFMNAVPKRRSLVLEDEPTQNSFRVPMYPSEPSRSPTGSAAMPAAARLARAAFTAIMDRASTPRRTARGLALDLRVQFRPGEDDVGSQIEPKQQNDDGAKRAIGLVVAADLRDVGREGDRTQDP
jgi:hypothetical protein